MVSKRKTQTTFAEVMMLLTFGGTLLIGYLLRLFVFGIGLMLVVAGFLTPENTFLVNSFFVGGGVAVIGLALFSKYVLNKVFMGLSDNPSDLRKRIVTYSAVGLSIVTFLVFLPSAVYWTSLAVNANSVKNLNTMVVGNATQQDWNYPFMIVPRPGSIGNGRSSSTDQQALVEYNVDGQQYTATTMVHMPKVSSQSVDLYYDPASPGNAVSWTLWSASVMQAVIFGSMALVCALGSAFLTIAVIKDRNFLYSKKTNRLKR